MRKLLGWAIGVVLAGGWLAGHAVAQEKAMFTNPIKQSGADPWVYQKDGWYYFLNTPGGNIKIWKTRDLTELNDLKPTIVWTPEPGKPWSRGIWAPELTRWGNMWVVYFCADPDNNNELHRVYAITNDADDPTTGTWTFRGQVADKTNQWAIDADSFELNGQHYLLWSGWEEAHNGMQRIYLAHLSNPWTIDSPRTEISHPTLAWEKNNNNGHPDVLVNEGPEAIVHGDKVFVVYSASGCWTDEYALGAVYADKSSNLLDPKSWKKIDHPLFTKDPENHTFGPGHNGFFKSPDGTDWIIYHANPEAGQGCGGHRSTRIQPFTWNADGTPNFGRPVPPGQPIPKPQ